MRKYSDFWPGGHFEIIIPEPFDFSLTVAKPAGWHWSTPRELFKRNTLWSGTYLDSTPVGLKIASRNNNVNVAFYTQSPLAKDERDALQTLIELGLGKDEDGAFYDFARNDDILSLVVKDLYGMRSGRADNLFGRVILAITLQIAPVK